MDLTNKKSMDGIDMWLREANEMEAGNLPTIIVGNKVYRYKIKIKYITYKL